MKELKGHNTTISRLFLGFGFVLTGNRAIGKVLLSAGQFLCRPAVLNHSPIRDPNTGLFPTSVTQWHSAPGFPFSFKSATQACRVR